MRLFYTFIFALAVIGAAAVSYNANAQEATSADKAYSEMKEMFGGIPSVMQIYPKSAVPAGWTCSDLVERRLLCNGHFGLE